MPDKSEVINKLILSAIIMLGIHLGHALAALFHIPGIQTRTRQEAGPSPPPRAV